MHPPSTPLASRLTSRTKLLDEALRLVRERGFTATSVEDLCRAAGVTKGAFFHQFASKEELGVEAVRHWSATTTGLLAQAPWRDPPDPLDRVLAYIDLRRALLAGEVAEFTCFAGTMVQSTDPTNRSAARKTNMTIWIASVAAGAVLAFVVGALWYGVLFGTAAATLSPAYDQAAAPQVSEVAFEALRCVALAAALAVLIRWTGVGSLPGALLLALLAWAGFQAAGLAGAVVHEGYPARLYAIHTGDALAKAVVASLAIAALTARFG